MNLSLILHIWKPLQAATTFDICKLLGEVNALTESIKIVTLLQPPPETFALFDELVFLSEGQVIYSGSVEKVVPYFESLGYILPERMDAADWLQVSAELLSVGCASVYACLSKIHGLRT